MSTFYDHSSVEAKWQHRWEDSGAHSPDLRDASEKLYCLTMFSYPSGDRLHIGHWYNYGPTDTWARFQRMQGRRVFQPQGFDAFGLPAENHAIKTGKHPKDLTDANTAFMQKQLHRIGAMYDWTRTVDTSKPDYYRWTQWLFLKLHERGLAYRKMAPVNWCPSCATVLANEQVHGGCCERCESPVTKKDLEQWFFRITEYADRLLKNLDNLDWPEKTKSMQRHWIGRSEGAEILFDLVGHGERVTVFTTRADTLMGATYLVFAPEHPLVEAITTASQRAAVEAYREKARRISEVDRGNAEREKTGVFTGAYARHPLTGEQIPVWIADYVLMGYGTGAIMAVPAHDGRDFEFAKKFHLPMRAVIRPAKGNGEPPEHGAFVEDGVMTNSRTFNGLTSAQGRKAVAAALAREGAGRESVHYRLRDWLVSRQRYWGAPIPMIFCEGCGWQPEREENLPVLLPYEVDLTKSKGGKSPLAFIESFVRAKCPECGGAARREAETMDTFVDSSWYFLRYPSARVEEAPWEPGVTASWLPVDMYVGGAEHACMHLLYARFVTMALYDMGLLPFEEPFLALRHQGTITNMGAKMSKSKGNVVSPDAYVEKHGADVFRMYLMFMGPYEEGGDWSDTGIMGIVRFRDRLWRFFESEQGREGRPALTGENLRREHMRLRHFTVKAVSDDLQHMRFNTAISRMMEWLNFLQPNAAGLSREDTQDTLRTFARLAAPFAPHLGEELWNGLGERESVFDSGWPSWDEAFLETDTVAVVVQVNGRRRGELRVPKAASESEVVQAALADEKIRAHAGGPLVKTVYVPGRLLNLVVKS
jgi:leucyl-tRNA synthetase